MAKPPPRMVSSTDHNKMFGLDICYNHHDSMPTGERKRFFRMEALHVPPVPHLPGATPDGQRVRVAVRRHELCSRVRCPGRLRHRGGPWFGGGPAGVAGACVPVPPPGSPAGRPRSATWGLASGPCPPPRRYTGRSCGNCHRLGHRAHNAAHHGPQPRTTRTWERKD